MAIKDSAVIVVGGDREHGARIAQSLADAGAQVLATAPPGESFASLTAPSNVVPFEGDVATAEAAQAAVHAALDQFGQLDAIVVNPALRRPPLDDVTAEVERAIDGDLRAAYTMLKHATIVFRQQRAGRAVILAPRDGLTGSGSSPVQGAIAGGLIGLMKAVSLGMSRYSVPCNAIAFDELDEDSGTTLGAVVGYLAGDAPAETSGHVFEVSGKAVSLWSHERPIVSIFDTSGIWEVSDLEEIAPAFLSVDPLMLSSGAAVAVARG